MNNDPIAKLRFFADNCLYELIGDNEIWEEAIRIADEIEAQYMRLPTDADGVTVRPEDEMKHVLGHTVKVVAVDSGRYFFVSSFADGVAVYDWRWAEHYHHADHDAIINLLEEYSNLLITSTNPKSLRDEYAKLIREVVNNG